MQRLGRNRIGRRADSDTVAVADAFTNADTIRDAYAVADSNSNSNSDADSNADADADADTDTDTNANTDPDAGAGESRRIAEPDVLQQHRRGAQSDVDGDRAELHGFAYGFQRQPVVQRHRNRLTELLTQHAGRVHRDAGRGGNVQSRRDR
ncbi:MAG: hypothetical protein JO036_06675 [Candidatus Eremiobacteraeota bacterium]|nr:hypothetical protein [Candidatus Eremiobacteraeota bacterium]